MLHPLSRRAIGIVQAEHVVLGRGTGKHPPSFLEKEDRRVGIFAFGEISYELPLAGEGHSAIQPDCASLRGLWNHVEIIIPAEHTGK